jgi:NTP pyrophosphatase (non-canonical NTP hydrolase)
VQNTQNTQNTQDSIKEFEQVREWKKIRGIGNDNDVPLETRVQSQMQRVFQEVIEIHDAIVKNDDEEFIDAIGDTIVTLINIADIKGINAEDCLRQSFSVIKLRKGLLSESGDFVRYAKLSEKDRSICDMKQGSTGNQYFNERDLLRFGPKNFQRN